MHYDWRKWILRTVTGVTAGCAATLAFAPKPATALTTLPAVYDRQTDARIIQEIGEKRRHGHGYRHRDRHHHHHYHYGYGPYRPYYGYRYWPDYYYGGYVYPYPYWSPPGVSIGFSF
jgi:hypothetical protein